MVSQDSVLTSLGFSVAELIVRKVSCTYCVTDPDYEGEIDLLSHRSKGTVGSDGIWKIQISRKYH